MPSSLLSYVRQIYSLMSFGWSTVKSGICLKSFFSSNVKISLIPLFLMVTL
jgi:hypothetical protein